MGSVALLNIVLAYCETISCDLNTKRSYSIIIASVQQIIIRVSEVYFGNPGEISERVYILVWIHTERWLIRKIGWISESVRLPVFGAWKLGW